MKTHTIKTPITELMIVELPVKAEPYTKGEAVRLKIDGKFNNWEVLGKPDEIREEDAVEIVDKSNFYNNFYSGKDYVYKNYKEGFSFDTATESLLSLLDSEIFWDVNPIPKPDYFTTENSHIHLNTWSDFMHEWHEAEKKTFDRNRSMILVKN